MTLDELSPRRGPVVDTQRAAPVIALAYPGSGAERLHSVLASGRGLTCTSGTGLLPLCHQAVAAWQAVDGRGGDGIPPLAAASVRALCGGLVTATLAQAGGHRLCEFATAPPRSAAIFLRLYPQAKILVVHRSFDHVLRAILGISQWGLAGGEFAPFVSANPGSTVAALAAYWVARTAPLLDFERAHEGSCLRVCIEDLDANAPKALREIGDFLGLNGEIASPVMSQDGTENDSRAGHIPGPGQRIPLEQIPAALLTRLNELLCLLCYPALAIHEDLNG